MASAKQFFISRFTVFIFVLCLPLCGFLSEAKANDDPQILADKIASFATKAIYNLDEDQLLAVLENFLSENPKIKALTISENIDDEEILSFFRKDNEQIYGQLIPDELLLLGSFSATSSFEGEAIGTVKIYFDGTNRFQFDVLNAEERDWLAKNNVISVGVEEWYPFVKANEDGQPGGIAGDFLSLILEKTGLKIKTITGEWANLLADFEQGNIDLLPATYYTEDRATYGLYSSPYFSSKEFIYTKKDEKSVHSFDNLRGKRLAIVKGYGTIPKIKGKFPEIEIVETKNLLASIYAVLNGEVDALYESQIATDVLIRQELITGLRAIGQSTFEASPLYFFSLKDQPLLQSILTKSLESITEQQQRDIIDKWVSSTENTTNAVDLPEYVEFDQSNFILKYIALFFAVLLVIIFITWIVRGRPTQLSIKEVIFLISFIFVGLILSIGTLVTMLLEGEERQSTIEAEKYQSLNLALELKQSSDDLTRFARSFAVTGDAIYERYFENVLAIRNGELAHPETFTHSYWDQVISGQQELDAEGERYSIDKRFRSLRLSENELLQLSLAKTNSDDLVRLETIAMNAVNGLFEDANGEFTIKKEPDLELARKILFGEEYNIAKAKIMKPIDHFFQILEFRTANDLNFIRNKTKAIILSITLLTILTIAFSIYVFFVLRRKVILPLSEFETGAHIISEGNYTHKIELNSKDELGTLALAFNSMSYNIEQRNHELQDAFNVISSSIEYASRIQESALPDHRLLGALVSDYFVWWEPRDVVGGDLYWVGAWGGGCLTILGDCTGHGVPGAFMTLISISAIERATSEVEGGDLGKLITRAHQYIQKMLGQHFRGGKSDDGIELGACYFVPEEPQMKFVGARFNLLIIENEENSVVKGIKAGMGYRKVPYIQEYQEEVIDLKEGQQFYMASDGIVDQVGGERGRSFGRKYLFKVLQENKHLPMKEQKLKVQQTFHKHQGNEKRRDDIAMIGFKF